MRMEREAFGLPPTTSPPPANSHSTPEAAGPGAKGAKTDLVQELDFEEGRARGEEYELMWLVWPFQARVFKWSMHCRVSRGGAMAGT